VLTEVHELKDERLEGLLDRGYVKANPEEGETDATVLERMEEQRHDRMWPTRSASFRKEALARREQTKVNNAQGEVARAAPRATRACMLLITTRRDVHTVVWADLQDLKHI
jgi:hypothetical protein